jgi:hypothetical protein
VLAAVVTDGNLAAHDHGLGTVPPSGKLTYTLLELSTSLAGTGNEQVALT